MAKPSRAHGSKNIRRRRKTLLKKGVLIVSCSCAVIILFAFVARLSPFLITTVYVDGETAVEEADIKKFAGESLEGNYLKYFPRRNVLLYPKREIIKKIQSAYPRIQDINVGATGFTAIKILVKEREAYGVWCDTLHPTDCYFLDLNGYIFSEAKSFSKLYKKFYGEKERLNRIETGEAGNSQIIGKNFLSPQEFINIQKMIAAIESVNLTVEEVRQKDGGTLSAKTERGNIIFDQGLEPDTMSANLGLFLENRRERFEYVDVRYENKIYYKLENELAE